MSHLLCIPFKKTLSIDLKQKLANVIDSTFFQTSSIFGDDLSAINRMREDLINIDVSESGLQKMKTYYICFSKLKEKFPDNQIEYTWFQTLGRKSYGCSHTCFLFEEINVVYNIGAMYSLLAMENSDGSVEGLKKSCHYFQYSAGCFGHIIKLLESADEKLLDRKTLTALNYLMLAQAQEAFWFKAVKDSHKDSLIAKLALQVSELYDTASKHAHTSEIIRTDWVEHLKSKSLYFSAVAHYRNSIALGEKEAYGAQIKSLQESLKHLNKASLGDESALLFRERVENTLKSCERDNDLIFLQGIPSIVPEIRPALMVRNLYFAGLEHPAPDSTPDSAGTSLFKNLLPVSIMESSTAFGERQQLYVKEYVTDTIRALNKLLNGELPSCEIPSSLKPLEPKELETYEDSLKELSTNNKQVYALLCQANELLQQESETDSSLRTKHGSLRWTLPESDTVNKEYRARYQKLMLYLQRGTSIDKETFELFETVDKMLVSSPIRLPESNDPLVKEVLSIIKKRDDYVTKVEQKCMTNKILPKIITAYKSSGLTDFESIYNEHLRIFDEDLQFVRDEKRRNQVLCEKLASSANKESKMKRLDPKDLYIQDFKHSLEILGQVKENIIGGTKFYQDLLKNASGLLNDIQVFELARRKEKKALEAKLVGELC